MREYRLYFLDKDDHVLRAVDLTCDDDGQATAASAEHRYTHAKELWGLARLVCRLEPSTR